MLSGSLRLCADSSPARAPAVISHGSPGRSPFRCADATTASQTCRRQLELCARALPSDFDASSHGASDRRVVSSVPATAGEPPGAALDSWSPRGDIPEVMCSPFRQLLTSSSPDIHTLHSILIKLHRSEATTADLHHSGQSISLLYSLASDSSNADSADMATAILASLATSPAARGQLPAHVREHLTDALVSLVDNQARGSPSFLGESRQRVSTAHIGTDATEPCEQTQEPSLPLSVHGILHTELPPAAAVAPEYPRSQSASGRLTSAALAEAAAETYASGRDDDPPAPVVTELDSDLYQSRSQWRAAAEPGPARDSPRPSSGIPCPDPVDPSGDSPAPAVFRKMSARTSAFLRASSSPPTSAAAAAISLATSAARATGKRRAAPTASVQTPRRSPAETAAPAAPAGHGGVVTAAPSAAAPSAAPPRIAHSLRDSESDAAVVTAVTLFLSKCGLVRSSLARATPLAGVLSAGGVLPDGASKRTAEEEEGARLAGRRSAAALAVGAAAAADEVILRQLHTHDVPHMLRRWMSSGDDVVALTGLLVFLALTSAPLHQTPKPASPILARPATAASPRSPRQRPAEATVPPLLTAGVLREVTACCQRLLSQRAAPYTRSVAFTAVAAVAAAGSRMPCIDDGGGGGGVSMRDALVGGLAHAGFCGTAKPSCQALLAPLTPVFYHEGTAVRTVAAAAAAAVAALAQGSDDELLRFVEAGAVPALRRLLECGGRDECDAAAAALAELARHPSAHTQLLSSGTCDTLITYAGSQDPELQQCQAGMALALARLSLNAATQFTLIGRGLATAVASMIAHAPSACMPSVSTIIMAVVGEGNSQGAVLVRAGVVRELVAFLRCHMPCAHLRSAHSALHSLLVHAHIDAAAAALQAGAVPHLLFALSSSDGYTRKRCARMLALLLEASPMAAVAALERLDCVPALSTILRAKDLPERAEAVDILYLMRRSPGALDALAEPDALEGLVAILAALVHLEPHYALRRGASAARRASSGVDRRHARGSVDGGENGKGSRFVVVDDAGVPVRRRRTRSGGAAAGELSAAEHGLFRSTVAAGTTVDKQAVVGKVVRLLLAMAGRAGKAQAAVAGCAALPPLLAALVARTETRQRTVAPLMLLRPVELPPDAAAEAAEGRKGGILDEVQRELADMIKNREQSSRLPREAPLPLPWELVEYLNHDSARDGPLLTVPGASTYDVAELLLSFIHDAGALPRSAVLEPLVTQAWLGNNVDLLHTSSPPCASSRSRADVGDAPQQSDDSADS
eukprot:jgi/Ulvmu1/5721/UM024_0074.1